jgi:cell division cycle 2-like
MGAAETKENMKSLSNYSFLKRESHAYYGEVSLMKEKENGSLVAIKEQVYQHNRDFQIELRNLTQQTKRIHQNILQLFKVASTSENHLCSTVYKLAWTMEFLEKDLNMEIASRRKNSRPFSERELWSLLFQVASGMAFLQSNNITHGDIRAEKIFISNDGVFKIVDPSTIKALPAYALLLTGSGAPGIYLSPQLMEAYRAQNWTPAHDVSSNKQI